jgi:hypothetical protein
MKSTKGNDDEDMVMDFDEETGAVDMYPKSMFNQEHQDPLSTDEQMAVGNTYQYQSIPEVKNLADYESSSEEEAPAPEIENGNYYQQAKGDVSSEDDRFN